MLLTEFTVKRPDLIISGGQSGADLGSLKAGKSLEIATGGYAPAGFKTENGPNLALKHDFGLLESHSYDYNVRTAQNVEMCDAVILIARNPDSPGSRLTYALARDMSKPFFKVIYPTHKAVSDCFLLDDIRHWLSQIQPSLLMVAGNRESVAKGIERWSCGVIHDIFVDLDE